MAGPFCILDVDGYAAVARMPQSSLVTYDRNTRTFRDGYRPRELAVAYSDGTCEVVYFYDSRKLPRLSSSDPGVRYVYRKVNGLPMNPGPNAYGCHRVRQSHMLLAEIARIISYMPDGAIIYHKGGNEGLWAREALAAVHRTKITVKNLEDLGFPQVRRIYLSAEELGEIPLCGHHRGLKVQNRHHCPLYEVCAFRSLLKNRGNI